MAYSGIVYVCLNEDKPHVGHWWPNPVGNHVLCPGVTADEITKRLRAQLHQAEERGERALQRCKEAEAERDANIERAEAAETLVERCKLALRESATMLRTAANDAQTQRQDDDAKAFRKAAEFAHRIKA